MRDLTLRLIINAVTDGFRAGIAHTRAGLDQVKIQVALLATMLVSAGGGLTDFSNKAVSALYAVEKAGKAAFDALKRDVVNFGKALAVESIIEWRGVKFEANFADVKKVVTGTIDGIKGLRNELLDMSAAIAMGTDGLAKMQAQAGQLGLPIDEIDEFVKLSSKGAVAFELLPEQAAQSFGNLKNIYDLNLKELEFLGDQINYIADKANTNESALLDVMNRSGGVAQRFGLLRGETVALAAAMLAMGKPPELVGTAMDMLLSRLQNAKNQSKDFREGLQLLGMDAETLADNIEKNPKQALDNFLLTLSKLSAGAQTDILSRLIGEAGEAKGVIGDLIGKIGEYQRLTELSTAGDIAGSMEATFKERQKTVQSAIIMMKNAWDGLAISASTMFLPTIRAVAEGLRDLAVWLRHVSDEYPNLMGFARIAVIFGTLGTVLRVAFSGLPAIVSASIGAIGVIFNSGIINVFKAAIPALGAIGTFLAESVFGRLIAGAVLLTVGFNGLVSAIGAVSSVFVTLVSSPLALFLTSIGLVAIRVMAAHGALGVLGAAFGGVGRVLLGLVGGPIGLAISALAFLAIKYNEIKDDTIKFGNASVTLSEILGAVWSNLKTMFADGVGFIGSLFNDLGSYLLRLVGISDSTWQKIETGLADFLGDAKSVINQIIGAFDGLGKAAGVSLAVFVEHIRTELKQAVALAKAAADDIQAAWHGDFSATNFSAQLDANAQQDAAQKSASDYAISDALTSGVGKDYLGGLADGFKSSLDSAGKAVVDYSKRWQDAINADIVRQRAAATTATSPGKDSRMTGGGVALAGGESEESHETAKKRINALLDANLSAIKTRQNALQSAHELDLKQLETNFKTQELALKQQGLSEIDLQEKSIVLAKDLADKKLEIERKFILESAALTRAAIVEKMQAAQADAPVSSMAQLFKQAEEKYRLPPNLVQAVAQVESAGGKNAGVSSAGALGVMQLMPATAKSLGVTDRTDPAQSIEGGAKLLRELLDTFNGDVKLALMAYNSNPTKVKAVGGDLSKMKPETQAYVPNVLAAMKNPAATGSGDSAEAKQALSAKLAGFNAELLANEADTQAKLKALGLDGQNAAIEQSTEELALKKAMLEQQKALDNEQADAEHAAALDALSVKEIASQQELDLGNINNEQHLANLRNFAADRLAIEMAYLEDKRKLLGKDQLALAQNLDEMKALYRQYQVETQGIDNKDARDKQEHFKQLFAPLSNALDQSVNGILTGQQTVKHAVQNAANSIVVSYAASFIKTRVLSAAQWAWEVMGFAGKEARQRAIKNAGLLWDTVLWAKKQALMGAQWAWEVMGFGAKEATQTATVVASQAIQTGAEVTKDVVTTASHVAATETKDKVTFKSLLKSIFAAAKQAAAFTYQSVAAIPFIGWAIAPAAAAVAFAAVMALGVIGSAEKGEMEVAKDNSPFLLHKKESVLPAGVAENFRYVVNIVKAFGRSAASGDEVVMPERQAPANVSAAIQKLSASGQLHGNWQVPQSVLNIAAKSKDTAEQTALNAKSGEEQRQAGAGQSVVYQTNDNSQTHFSQAYHNSFIDTNGAKRFFDAHGDIMAQKFQEKARKGAFGPKGIKL